MLNTQIRIEYFLLSLNSLKYPYLAGNLNFSSVGLPFKLIFKLFNVGLLISTDAVVPLVIEALPAGLYTTKVPSGICAFQQPHIYLRIIFHLRLVPLM